MEPIPTEPLQSEDLFQMSHLDFANLVVLGETVVIKDCEYQRLVKGFAIRYLEIIKISCKIGVKKPFFSLKNKPLRIYLDAYV